MNGSTEGGGGAGRGGAGGAGARRTGAGGAGAGGRRADARRSRAAVLDAAAEILNDRPDASMESIAAAAGVTRQTVYAHFPSRDRLLAGVLDRITEEAVAAMDAAALDEGPAPAALLRALDAAAGPLARYPALSQALSTLPTEPSADRGRHAPISDRIARVLRRGRRTGEFDARLPVEWLATAIITLAHLASTEHGANHLTDAAAKGALRTSVLRLTGAAED